MSTELNFKNLGRGDAHSSFLIPHSSLRIPRFLKILPLLFFLSLPLQSASPPEVSTTTRRYTMQDVYKKEKKMSFWERLENNLTFLGGLALAIFLPGSSVSVDTPNVKVRSE